MSKKRRIIETDEEPIKIISNQGSLWLVEWSNQTRTWISYDRIKNFELFKTIVSNMFRNGSFCSYIS